MIALAPQLLRAASAGFFALALAAAWWRMPQGTPPLSVAPTIASPPPLSPAFSENLLPRADAVAGPATLTQLPDGRLAAAWLAGPVDDENAAAIWLSMLGNQGWSTPRKIAMRESVAAGTLAHLGPLGRPVLFAEGGWLHLWHDAAPPVGRVGRAIVHSVSTDGGKSWSKAERLPALAGGLSGPVQPLADGGLALPVNAVLPGGEASWLRLSVTGRLLDKTRPRDTPISLPATSGATARLRLTDGRLLLAGNPATGRDTLQLWLSADAGQTWTLRKTIETAADGNAEFTDPTLLQGRDGQIHLAYTWRRQTIKYQAFTITGLAGEM